MIISFAMLYLAKLFDSISKGDTPFTLENLKNIKRVAILFISYLIFPDVSGTLFQWITKIDMNIDYEITKIFYVLIIIYYFTLTPYIVPFLVATTNTLLKTAGELSMFPFNNTLLFIFPSLPSIKCKYPALSP